jgi:hypothetical protein
LNKFFKVTVVKEAEVEPVFKPKAYDSLSTEATKA